MSALNAESTAFRSALEVVRAVEPRIADAIAKELHDQRESLKLIASENYASPAVLLAMGNWLSDKYAEGTIGRRFYAGCQNVDTVEAVAAEHARELFGTPQRVRSAALRHRREPGRVLGDPGRPGRGAVFEEIREAPGQRPHRCRVGRVAGRVR